MFLLCSDNPLSVWLLSNPKTNKNYEQLTHISKNDDILKDLDIPTSGTNARNCLALSRLQNDPPQFSLTALDCNQQMFAICRIKPPAVPPPKKPLTLPCSEKRNNKRRKRSSGKSNQLAHGIFI